MLGLSGAILDSRGVLNKKTLIMKDYGLKLFSHEKQVVCAEINVFGRDEKAPTHSIRLPSDPRFLPL